MKRFAYFAALAMLAGSAVARPGNYEESTVPPFTLEDPLAFADGRKLKGREEWPARRAEILRIFECGMYGRMPPKPDCMVAELTDEKTTMSGFAIRRRVRQFFKEDKSGPFVDWMILRPRFATGPVPVILFLNPVGAIQLLPDDDLTIADGYREANPGPQKRPEKPPAPGASKLRGAWCDPNNRNFWPIGDIIARGYAVMTACYFDIAPDPDKKTERATKWRRRCFDLWPAWDDSAPDNTKSLMAWAWGLCRGLDLAEQEPGIDAKRAVVTGCSRLGKAALIAGAFDDRFAVVVPNQTGHGGAPLTKHYFGENIETESKSFPHWFTRSYFAYAGKDETIPFDQHLLLACVAPRRLLIEGFDQKWFDTRAEYLSCKAAGPVWEFLGKPGFPDRPFPADFDTSCIGSHVGYVRRSENHGLSPYDWRWMLDFADRAFSETRP